jgi:hypothetical protein
LIIFGAAASGKVYQLLAHGQWFSPGTPVSSTTKTGCHDIAEILLKVALNTITLPELSIPFFVMDFERIYESKKVRGRNQYLVEK